MIFMLFFITVLCSVCAALLLHCAVRSLRYRTCKCEATGTVVAIRRFTGWSKELVCSRKHKTEYRFAVVEFVDNNGRVRSVTSSSCYSERYRVGSKCRVRYNASDVTLARLVEPNTTLIAGVVLLVISSLAIVLFSVMYGVTYL